MLIYKQYDQAALDRQYNNRLHVPDFATCIKRWRSLSRETENEYPVVKDIAYCKLSREQLDIYPSSQPSSKTLIFIHGGYWKKFDKADFQFIAKAFRAYGITTVLINYPLTPVVPIDQVLLSCRGAIHWLYKNIPAYNGDPDQLYIAGHSAGGQLAAMLMTTDSITPDSCRDEGNPFTISTAVIKGVCVISGIFNLEPIRLSDLNQVLNMDKVTALRNSPVQLSPATLCPLAIVVGGDETDEFLDQSQELYACWKEIIPAEIIRVQGLNHFSILETMLDPGSCLHQVMRKIMKI
jgi:arylformamidase